MWRTEDPLTASVRWVCRAYWTCTNTLSEMQSRGMFSLSAEMTAHAHNIS
jgi:hypothetical protein